MRFVFVCLSFLAALPASAQDISVSVLHLEMLYGNIPTQWITIRNTSKRTLRGVWAECTFFDGTRPTTRGAGRTTGALEAGGQQTISVGGSPPAPATRAECHYREANF